MKERLREGNADADVNKSRNEEDGIDALLDAYQKQSLELSTPLIEVLGLHPSNDGNARNKNNSTQFPYPP